MTTSEEMSKAYNPAAVETSIYERWEASGAFTPDIDQDKEPFTIIMPPPNLTGELHLGHAMMDTVEDLLIRWRRMQGRPALYLPGVDHAAIAVHTLIERQLATEGLARRDIGREAFLERTWEFVNRNRARIFEQHKRLGISADWTRERFTMDPGPAKAVRTFFVDLYNKGLIYRGNRLINWCPGCQSALSDLEVDHEEVQSFLWHIRYPIVDQSGNETGEYITFATTRPETIVADVAIAVHPDDARYAHLRGAHARLPFIGRLLPIVFDEAIDKDFGTGALKVTPGHDQVDFEIGERHNLSIVSAIATDGRMNDEAGPFTGLDRFAARQAIVDRLRQEGLLLKEEPYTHAVGHCDRCGSVVEPLMSLQWFVAMTKQYGALPDGTPRSLAGDALKAVTEGWVGPDGTRKQIKMVPDRHTRVYINWLENIRDWTISRQLWWGHRIPVWYCDNCEQMTVTIDDPSVCEHCRSEAIHQDEDTLDTWFSSALWPMSTLGWPHKTPDLAYFYPTSVMETGYDIIFLWVARMIMSGIYALNEIPFEWVYFHGTVRDDQGQRMSKSKGNGVDPLVLIERYGSDAVRFKLITAGGTGNDQRLEEPRFEAARNFANKLWNASRFVLGYLGEGQRIERPSLADRASMPVEDRWVLSLLDRLVSECDRLMERFELGEAGRQIEDFIWDVFCDWYLEIAKLRLRSGEQPSLLPVLVHVLDTSLRLLHPYMPYVTEELWSGSGDLRSHLEDLDARMLITAEFPRSERRWADENAEREMALLQDIVRSIRNLRRERGIDAGRWMEAYVVTTEDLSSHANAIEALARVRPLHLVSDRGDAPAQGVASAVLDRAQVILSLAGSVDAGAERASLQKQLAQAQGGVAASQAKLGNEKFLNGAPAQVVESERERLAAAQARVVSIEERLRELGSAGA
jgi:valyl-tRNA synthetase